MNVAELMIFKDHAPIAEHGNKPEERRANEGQHFQTLASAENKKPWRGYYILTWAEGLYSTGPKSRHLDLMELEPEDTI